MSVSRRKFLVGAGVATGALAVTGAGLVKPQLAQASYPAFPWAYNALNVDLVRRRGYDNYYTVGCMRATAKALLDTLAETSGGAWSTVPQPMFKYGVEGVKGWGTTCGALNGACYVIQACAGSNVGNLHNSLLDWYCKTALPTTQCDAYASIKKQKTTVPSAPLCHASATRWCYSANVKIDSAARRDRCAKVGAQVAARTAELLNALRAGTYSPTWVQPDPTCSNCHVGATSTYDHVQMKSTCTAYCHKPGFRGFPKNHP